MRLLLVNDDGYQAPGIQVLYETLKDDHEVWVVAPDREVSAVGHAITLRNVLRAHTIRERFIAVEGNPTDCVNLALYAFMPEKPDMILSGINIGWNLSEDVTYSGTVAGALEGAIHGIPSVAISVPARASSLMPILQQAGHWLSRNLQSLASLALPDGVFLNINWPERQKPRGIRITRLGRRMHENIVVHRVDPRGVDYYWLERGEPLLEPDPSVDVHAVFEGYVSLSPLSVDWTHEPTLIDLESWIQHETLETDF